MAARTGWTWPSIHRRISRRIRPCTWAALVVGSGCAPTFAPPIRTVHGGAPGRLDPGDMEISVAPVAIAAPFGGGGSLGYAVREHLTVEGGVDGSDWGWTMGWGGVRMPVRRWVRPRIRLAADGEIGVGAGVGGQRCGNHADEGCEDPPVRPWHDRVAGGAYLGVGGAVRFSPVSIFARTRAQLSAAKGIPVTQWISGSTGLHFHILRHADLWTGFWMARYDNAEEDAWGYGWEAGVGFRFDPRVGWRDR